MRNKHYFSYRKSDTKVKEWIEILSALIRIILHVLLIVGLV